MNFFYCNTNNLLWIIEFSKKKRKLVVLSDSDDDNGNSDDNGDLNTEIKLTSNDLMPFGNEVGSSFSTQQLLGFCSGKFETENPKTQVSFVN